MNDLATLLEVRDTLNKECLLIPTPSISVGMDKKQRDRYDSGYNGGLVKSLVIVMDMIGKIAKFVSVCCGVKGIEKIEEWKGGGRCYTICSKCKKECEQEWRKR